MIRTYSADGLCVLTNLKGIKLMKEGTLDVYYKYYVKVILQIYFILNYKASVYSAKSTSLC